MAKALALDADTLCFDLEDSVAPAAKETARQAIAKLLQAAPRSQAERCVRINALQSDEWRRDISVVMQAQPDALMIPKAEDPAAVARLSQELAEEESRVGLHPGATRFLLIVETARGVLRALDVATAAGPRLSGVLFGAEDLAADVGLVRTRDSVEVLVARTQVALTAAATRVGAIDQVFVDIKDLAGLEAEARAARVLGYTGKMAIHPDQLAPIHRAFTPTREEIERALRLLHAAQAHAAAASAPGPSHEGAPVLPGAFAFEGRMIDAPFLAQAQRVVRTAQRAGILNRS